MNQLDRIKNLVLKKYDIDIVQEAVNGALDSGIEAKKILHESLIPAIYRGEELLKTNEMYIPELLVAARLMKAGLELLETADESLYDLKTTVVLGTLEGDLHDIGKSIVSLMLRAGGYTIVDLGVDVGYTQILDEIRKGEASVLGLSASLTTTMPHMEKIIQNIEEADLRKHVKIVLGGGPVTDIYAKRVGADGYGANSKEAVETIDRLLKL